MRHGWVLVMLAACGSSKRQPPPGKDAAAAQATPTPTSTAPPAGPVAIKISGKGSGSVQIESELGKGWYYPDENLAIVVDAEGPAGTKIEWQGQSVTLGAEPSHLRIDYWNVAMRDEIKPKHLHLPIVVTAPGGAPVSATLDFGVNPPMERLLAVTQGPVPFPGDDRATQKTDVGLVISNGFAEGIITKREDTPRFYDVDVVIVQTFRDYVVKDCGMYSNGSQRVRRRIMARDATDVVYDRRTGKQLGNQTFAGSHDASCEKSFDIGGADPNGHFDSLDNLYSEVAEHDFLYGFVTAPTGTEIDVPASTVAGVAASAGGPAPPAKSNDPGTGFPTIANLEARMAKLGWEPRNAKLGNDPYPVRLDISSGIEGGCVTLYDFAHPQKQLQPTIAHVGPRRAVMAFVDAPTNKPFLDKVAPKLAGYKPERVAQLGTLFSGTGLKMEKDDYGMNKDDQIDGAREWDIDASTDTVFMAVRARVIYIGAILDGKVEGTVAAVEGDRILVLGCYYGETPIKDKLATLLN